MFIKKEDYNIINYLKNYGSDVFDPIDYYQLNTKIYDKNFVDLLKHILCIVGNKCVKLKGKREEIKELDIIRVETYDLNDLNDFRNLLKELMLYVNDLLKIFVMLYNLEMGFAYYIQNGDINMIKNNKEIFEEMLLSVNPSGNNKEKLEKIYKNLPEKKFTPMEYNPYKDDKIYLLNEEELIVLSDFLLNEVARLEAGIIKLLKLSKKLSFIMTPDEVSKKILKSLVPIIPEAKDMIGGADPPDDIPNPPPQEQDKITVISAYEKLKELNRYLNGISSMSLEMEIPELINLGIDKVKDLISNFDLDIDRNKNIELKFNTLRKIPDYKSINFNITDPYEGKDPTELIEKLKEIDLITIIQNKIEEFKEKNIKIKETYKKLGEFEKSSNGAKELELEKIINFEYKFSDIGDINDVKDELKKKEEIVKNNNLEIETNEKDLEIYTDDFITKLVEYENNIKELEAIRDLNVEEDVLKIKNMLFSPRTGNKKYDDEDIKRNYNIIFEYFLKEKYKKEFFLDDNNYKNFEQLKTYLEEKMNNHKEKIGIPEYPPFFSKLNINDDNDKNIIKEYIFPKINIQHIGKETKIPEIYDKIIKKLDEFITKYDTKNKLEEKLKDPELKTKYEEIKPKLNGQTIRVYIETIKTNLQSEIEKTQIEIEKTQSEIEILKKNLESDEYKTEQNFSQMISFTETKFKERLNLLHEYLTQINDKVQQIYKFSKIDDIKEFKIATLISEISSEWYKENQKENQKGGEFTNILENIGFLNNISLLNDKMKELINEIEKYKLESTILIEKYSKTVKNIQDIIIYVYYKLTTYNDVIKGYLTNFEKFNTHSLIELKEKIINIRRKNFDLLKIYTILIIDDILEKMKGEKMKGETKKYVDYGVSNGLLNLFLLHHIRINF